MKSKKDMILRYWNQVQCPQEDITNCFIIDEPSYSNLVRVGLSSKSTKEIMAAILSCIGQQTFQSHFQATNSLAQRLGIQGFTFRVTELNHPEGFPYLVIGFVVD